MLYSTFHGNRNTRNGILQEDTTIEEYKLKKAEENQNLIVQRSGLVILPEQGYIPGSPDGIVSVSTGETGLKKLWFDFNCNFTLIYSRQKLLFNDACQRLIGFECNKYFIYMRPVSPVDTETIPSGLPGMYLCS
jgi:hypothetical protein